MSERHAILIQPSHLLGYHRELLRVLQDAISVKISGESGGISGCSAELLFDEGKNEAETKRNQHLPRLTIPASIDSAAARKIVELGIQFANDSDVPFPFRGRSVLSNAAEPEGFLNCGTDEKVLATSDGSPVWVVSTGAGPKRYRSAFTLPVLSPDRTLQDVLNGNRFIEILPLVHFLREICDAPSFEGPPLRACFIFDDPNLHWPRYGFVDFQQIATHAEKQNYHVSFATIPLDTWFTHGPTAQVFRNHNARLSLCVHGNNHLREELARDYSRPARISLLRQAIRRVENLERKTGLQVCRVMVPPHGACTEAMLAELPHCGFEAACISHGSLRAYNRSKSWTQSLGVAPLELIQGCPVMPRWSISGNVENAILLAAFLRQPIILRGHHQDLREGIEVLDRAAQLINSFGPVLWSNLTNLSRLNYQWAVEGDICVLRPLGRAVTFRPPDMATRLTVENPRNGSWAGWRIVNANGVNLRVKAGECISWTQRKEAVIAMEMDVSAIVPIERVSIRSTAHAVLRRLLTEGRDRFLRVS